MNPVSLAWGAATVALNLHTSLVVRSGERPLLGLGSLALSLYGVTVPENAVSEYILGLVVPSLIVTMSSARTQYSLRSGCMESRSLSDILTAAVTNGVRFAGVTALPNLLVLALLTHGGAE